MSECHYRGYRIVIVPDGDGWKAGAHPARADQPAVAVFSCEESGGRVALLSHMYDDIDSALGAKAGIAVPAVRPKASL